MIGWLFGDTYPTLVKDSVRQTREFYMCFCAGHIPRCDFRNGVKSIRDIFVQFVLLKVLNDLVNTVSAVAGRS